MDPGLRCLAAGSIVQTPAMLIQVPPSRRSLLAALLPLAGALAAALPVALAGLAAGCSRPADGARAPEPLRIFAAASTAEWIGELAAAFPGGAAPPVLGGSSDLARQIEAGAPADVFISANRKWAEHLIQRGLAAGPARVVAGNRLVAVAGPGAGFGAAPIADAAGLLAALPAGARLAIANEGVPAGDYARAALASLGLSQAAAPRLVGLADVRAVLRAVESGDLPAGFVYASDARAADVRVLFGFDPALHPPIEYLALDVAPAERRQAAQAFLDSLQSPAARARLAELGFEPAP